MASKVAFLIAGVWGLAFLSRKTSPDQFIDPRERWPYLIVFIALLLTAYGSAYYHLAPDNDRLVWDRVPMTIVFMALVSGLIAERSGVKVGLWLLPILTAVGVGSVIQWHLSVERGAVDLRFFGAVQLHAALALFAVLLLPPRYTHGSGLLVVAGLYVLAKICETADRQIFSVGHIVSGTPSNNWFPASLDSGFCECCRKDARFMQTWFRPRQPLRSDRLVVLAYVTREPTSNDRGDWTALESAAVEG